jgi:hypothetical protein
MNTQINLLSDHELEAVSGGDDCKGPTQLKLPTGGSLNVYNCDGQAVVVYDPTNATYGNPYTVGKPLM